MLIGVLDIWEVSSRYTGALVIMENLSRCTVQTVGHTVRMKLLMHLEDVIHSTYEPLSRTKGYLTSLW